MSNVDGSVEQVKEVEGAGRTDNESGQKVWTEKSLKAEWRRFNLDLSPKVCSEKILKTGI